MSTFYDPSVSTTKHVAAAARPASLKGRVVGFYDNTKEQGDVILEAAADYLKQHHGVKETFNLRGTHYSKPAPLQTIEEMARKCDVVVCALGG